MPSLPNLYTGKEAGSAVPSFNKTEQSSRDVMSGLIGAQKDQVRTARADADAFQELMKFDPVSLIGNQALAKQAKMMEDFKTQGSEIYKQRGGSLTEMDKANIAALKRGYQAEQMRLQGASDRLVDQLKKAATRPDYWDTGYAAKEFKRVASGEVPLEEANLLQIKPYSYEDYTAALGALRDNMAKKSRAITTQNGIDKYSTNYVWGENDVVGNARAREGYKILINSDDRARGALINAWDDLTSTAKQQWLDKADINNDQNTDPTETENAIMMFGFENAKPVLFGGGSTEEKRAPRTSTYGGRETDAQRKTREREEAMKIENLVKKGYTFTDSKYRYVPSREGYSFVYDSTLSRDEKMFGVPSGSVSAPSGKVVASEGEGGVVNIEPVNVDAKGETIKAKVPVYTIKDTVRDRRIIGKGVKGREKELRKMFDEQDTNVVVDGKDKYVRDDEGNIYRVGDKVSYVMRELPYEDTREFFASYFPKLDNVIRYNRGNGEEQAPVTQPKAQEGTTDLMSL